MILLIFLILPINVFTYKYLVISPVYGYSHMKCLSTIANDLADAGHQVTYFQPFVYEEMMDHNLIKNETINIINYYYDDTDIKPTSDDNMLSQAWDSSKFTSDVGVGLMMGPVLHQKFSVMCEKIFKDEKLHDKLKNLKFDVAISETFDFCGLFLADYLKIPSIISTYSGNRMNAISPVLGEPSSIHYLPSPFARYGLEKSTIYDRLLDLWHLYFNSMGHSGLFDRQYNQISELTNGKIRHWKNILSDVTYHFANSNPYLDFVIPTISKIIPIGGYTMDLKKVEKVSDEFDRILNQRKYNVFISYGSIVLSKQMPDSYKQGMLKLFIDNPDVTFLWKYEDLEDEVLKNAPKNLIVRKWFPQPALLADKRVNLFITHGGLGSTMELAYAAKPAIVTPLFSDQPRCAQMLGRHGSVEVYSKFEIPNWQKQSKLLRSMLSNDSYQKNANRLAELLKHQPINPKTLMISYAENAARFGKIPSLTPWAKDMGIIQFYNLDIILYFIVITIALVYFIAMLCCKKSNKVKMA